MCVNNTIKFFYIGKHISDEPTSGLDARATAIVMRIVKNIVSTKWTVVCTIHQLICLFHIFTDTSCSYVD
jgi:ABC-type multidrug transport system ATPase subunit